MEQVADTVSSIEDKGIHVNEVMAGSTATAKYTAQHPVVTEIHPGMYPFYDARLRQCMPDVDISDCAMTVRAMVISKPTANRVIVDAGSKAISFYIDQEAFVKEHNVRFYKVSEEYAWTDIRKASNSIEVGDRMEIVMPHVCTTVNLHDTLIGVRDARVDEIWEIVARGRLK
jgi:D-serine deaminase-like pyridoxal phosphate-dependent protein